MKRRKLITSTALATGASLIQTAAGQSSEFKVNAGPTLRKGGVILFQGDSITDAGRSRKEADKANNPAALGRGYPLFAASGLLGTHPGLDLKVFNRGISGHKVPQLQARWQKDTLNLKPAILSILVGVNDIWHKMNGKYDGTVETYRDGLDALIKDTKKHLPNTTVVICEPFALRCGAVKESWFPEFDQRRAAAKEVALKHKTIWVPFQVMFDDAIAAGTEAKYWARDGVHPTFAGHSLMARRWQAEVGL
ncbi:SGNH/GDSL hydrolase family protein [Akkermansiaceae bacterium]|nr:SGNH/GDSL hydrolase family protein [Akkermansiaceae bacterium]